MAWEGKEATLATIVYRVQYRGDRGGRGRKRLSDASFSPSLPGHETVFDGGRRGRGSRQAALAVSLWKGGMEGGKRTADADYKSPQLSPSFPLPLFPLQFLP